VQLIKLAVAGAKKQETSFKTHVRQALRAGATESEIEHAIIQLLTSEGLGGMMIAMKWATESFSEARQRNP
jgi:AhpD family alkylhydroperoxidase